MRKLHWEILDEQRKVVFEKLFAFRRMGYLSGGTSLALQILYTEDISEDEISQTELLE